MNLVLYVFLFAGHHGPVAAQSQQPETVTVSQAVQEAVEKNLKLLAERYNLNIADARIVAARLRPNPVLSVGGDHLELVLTATRTKIDRAQQEQSQIEARARALEAEIRNEIVAAWRQYETARTLLARIEDGMLLKARRVLDTMEYSYRSGEASLVEFLDARALSTTRRKVTTRPAPNTRVASA